MRPVFIKKMLRVLIIVLFAGIGIAVLAGILEWVQMGDPDIVLPLFTLCMLYGGTGLLFAVIGLFFSSHLADLILNWGSGLVRHVEKLPFPQLMSGTLCMILGLIVAALVSNIVQFMGASIFTTAFTALLYVCFGALAYTIGHIRSRDFHLYFSSFIHSRTYTFHKKTHRASRKVAQRGAPDKLLDASVLIDGRIADLCRIGFIEGDLIIPDFIIEELHHIADSQEPSKRTRGQRGLDTITSLQSLSGTRIRTMQESSDNVSDPDVRLLRLSRDTGSVVITCDTNLAKIAAVSSIPVLNIHELASVLRPVVLPGQVLQAQIVKEGREPGQGVAYMDDGTMIVVENGKRHVGESVSLLVTSSLQTSAGRMVFARVDES